MKKKFLTFLLLLTTTVFCNGTYAIEEFSRDHTHSKTSAADLCAMASSAESWLEGQLLGENTLAVYFNTTQAEFIDFATAGNIQKIKVDVYWQPHSGSSIQLVRSDEIDDIYTGFSISNWAINIDNPNIETGAYSVQVTINDISCGVLTDLSIVEEEIIDPEENLPVELPEYNCGDTYNYENVDNQTALSAAAPGEVFFIGGFPLLLETVSGGSGVFSGTAIVPLPFGEQVVNVEFEDVMVNSDRKIYQGGVTAVSDHPGNYPDFTVDATPLNIGGDICQPPPPPPGYGSNGVNEVTGLNDWGFDPETGIHGGTQTTHDENGFDIYGNHADTGGPFNEEGCNREGLTVNGEPCEPSGGPNPEATNYANYVAPTIGDDISNIIIELKGALLDSLTQLNCGGIRMEMEGLMGTLGYNREFIFGESDRFFAEGMHLEFESEPEPLILNIERDGDAKLLEERHVDLYHCDRASYAINALSTALDEMATTEGLEGIKDEILQRIKDWTDYEYGLYHDDVDAFNDWLILQIGKIMKENSGLDNTYVSAESPSSASEKEPLNQQMQSIFDFNRQTSYYNSTASLDDQLIFDDAFTLEDAAFFFRQGDQKINGIDRAFFLEGLARQQTLSMTGNHLLPVKVEKTVGNKTYTIYLDNITFSTSGASLDAYIIIEDPESGKRVVFKALGIGFGPTGTTTESRLELDTDIEIRLNNAAMLILKGTEDTYVAWDCEGFSSMGVDAEIEFCRNFIIPLDANTLEPKPDPERYRLSIAVQDMTGWLEFYLTLDAPPFAVAQYQDVKWELTNMVLDFSSSETPAFTPLDGYASPYWDGNQMAPMWKGFYMGQLSATLPNDFSTGSAPITASAFDILIDDCGFSGGVKAGVDGSSGQGLISIEEGNLGGWPFSINNFEIRILKNQFAGAGMDGQVNVPIFEEYMDYEAVVYPGSQYKFTVSPVENVTIDMFLATGEIYEDSEIELALEDGEFKAVATLNGKIHVSTNGQAEDGVNINFPSLCFQDFQISNQAPYFSTGNWGFAEGTDTTGFGFQFNSFDLRLSNLLPYDAGEKSAGLGFDIDLVLNNALEINAGGGFGIEGILTEENNGRQKWKFDRIDVRSLSVNASFPGASIAGAVEWYGSESNPDPTWGKGFRGVLAANFKGLDINLQAAAQFGKVDDFKYFYIDALAEFGAVAPGVGVIQLKGFGGGISYRMDVTQNAVDLVSDSGDFTLPPIGETFSGASYHPDKSKGLGLKATAIISTLKEEIFNGTVSLSFLFNNGDVTGSGSGLSKIEITGSGQFLKGIDTGIQPDFSPGTGSRPSSVNAKMAAFIELKFNFDEDSFHGDLEVFLNAGPLRGAGTGGKMVDAEIHFDPTQWYIYIGRPEEGQRCGVKFELPIVGGITVDAYMDVGTNVPSMPPIPAKVREIANKINNNQSLRQSGAGFVMGASLGFKLSASVAGIVSATLEAEAGFDMMLRHFEGLQCLGSNEPVGIDGWYAGGQIWAYVYGELKVLGINVASAGIAAALQARLPNPFWAQATVGIKVKLLFVTVHKSLKLELGDDCILVSTEPSNGLGMEVISFMEPYNDAEDVETDVQPIVYLNLGLNRNYKIPDLAGVEQTYNVSIAGNGINITYGNNINVPFTQEIFNDGTAIRIIPSEMLPANEEITLSIEVRINKNGSYLANEIKVATFTTTDALDYIPETNVKASYPASGMLNFYRNEYNKEEGYIKLVSGMSDLFVNVPEGYTQKVRLTGRNGLKVTYPFEYDIFAKTVKFELPAAALYKDQMYKIELLQIGSGTTGSGSTTNTGNPVTTSSTALTTALGGGAIDGNGPTSGNNATNGPAQDTEHIIYSIYFRVSEYETFQEKIDEINTTSPGTKKILSGMEPFDILEKKGSNKYEPLITFVTNLDNNWMNNDVTPHLEDLGSLVCGLGLNADIYEFDDAVKITGGSLRLLTKEDYETNFDPGKGLSSISLFLETKVKTARELLYDEVYDCTWIDLQEFGQSCNYPQSADCIYYNHVVDVLDAELKPMRNGDYEATVKYQLPGTNTTTTVGTIIFTKN